MGGEGDGGRTLGSRTTAGEGDRTGPSRGAVAATFASWVSSDGGSPVKPRGDGMMEVFGEPAGMWKQSNVNRLALRRY